MEHQTFNDKKKRHGLGNCYFICHQAMKNLVVQNTPHFIFVLKESNLYVRIPAILW